MSDGFKQCRGPVQLGGKRAVVTSLQTQHKALPGRAGGSRANIQGRSALDSPSEWQHLWQKGGDFGCSSKAHGPEPAQCFTHPPQDAPDISYPDHSIPGAGTPPGSHSPRGRGRGHGGFWLHLLCVPAALPASVLKRSQSERVPKGRKGFDSPVEHFCLSSLVGC